MKLLINKINILFHKKNILYILFLLGGFFASYIFSALSFNKNDDVFFSCCEDLHFESAANGIKHISYSFESGSELPNQELCSYLDLCRIHNNSFRPSAFCSSLCYLDGTFTIGDNFTTKSTGVAWCVDLGYISRTTVQNSEFYGRFTTFNMRRCVVDEETYYDYNITGSLGNGPCYISQSYADRLLLDDESYNNYKDLIGKKIISIKSSEGNEYRFVVSNVILEDEIYNTFQKKIKNDFVVVSSTSPIVKTNLKSIATSLVPNRVLTLYKFLKNTIGDKQFKPKAFEIGYYTINGFKNYHNSELILNNLYEQSITISPYFLFLFIFVSLASFIALFVFKKMLHSDATFSYLKGLFCVLFSSLAPPLIIAFISSIFKTTLFYSFFTSTTSLCYLGYTAFFLLIYIFLYNKHLFNSDANSRFTYHEIDI